MNTDKNAPIIMDIGANNGLSTLGMLRKDNIIIAIDPHPERYKDLLKHAAKYSNYHPLNCAISDTNAQNIRFNISAEDGGCSSLLEFSADYQDNWPGRPDIQKIEEIEVETYRLDTLLTTYFSCFEGPIEYLHIDTQGSDLKVLKGLGKELVRVQRGVMEAANRSDVLYKGQNQTSESCIWLEQNGFRVNDVVSNDPKNNEVNIYFEKV